MADPLPASSTSLLRVSGAQAIVLQHARLLPPESTALGPDVLGRVLSEDVAADRDMPPFDKAMMDGYAVRAEDLVGGGGGLEVIEEVNAGQVPRKVLAPGQATRIMTGAPVPPGANAVVPVERTQLVQEGRVEVSLSPRAGQHILKQGSEMRSGEVVLAAGSPLRAAELGLLATVGRTSALVHPAPQVAVGCTGDELAEADAPVPPGGIRNSNGPMLVAQARRAGARAQYLGIGRDNLDSLQKLIQVGLQADVLVLSGGVSAGKRDLVPDVLQEAGVTAHFHKVEMKPGKPLLFGTRARPDRPPTLVFGLPGNPVSSLVCFELFVHPAIRALGGHSRPEPALISATLAEDFRYSTDRPTYYPGQVEVTPQGWWVRPLPWQGSSDLRGLTRANVLILFPAGDHEHRAGQRLSVLPLE